jgi:hypothetical protein
MLAVSSSWLLRKSHVYGGPASKSGALLDSAQERWRSSPVQACETSEVLVSINPSMHGEQAHTPSVSKPSGRSPLLVAALGSRLVPALCEDSACFGWDASMVAKSARGF